MTPLQLKTFRKGKGYTQKALSLLLGISRRQIVLYENGHSRIPLTVSLACAALKHDLEPIGAKRVRQEEKEA